jgi:hypothetical protein
MNRAGPVRIPSLLPLILGLCTALPLVANAQSAAKAPAAGQPPLMQQRFQKTVPHIESGPWKGPRLPDGQPDIQGDWSNTIANHNNFTDPQGGIPGDPQTRRRPLGPRSERAPSRISDPADGQLPFQPWAQKVQQLLLANSFNPVQPEFVEPLARCAPAGVPKSFYWHGYEIRQFPGYIIFLFNSGSRIIHLDDKPHLPENIKLWNGDSRGHWEGNTLVVDVSNLNSKARFGRTQEFASEDVHVVERYIFDNDRKHYNYVATFTDPTVYTRSWTATVPARRYTIADDPPDEWHYEIKPANRPGKPPIADHYERVCVENDEGFGQVATDPKAATAAPQPANH